MERYRISWFLTGVVVALAFLFILLEWSGYLPDRGLGFTGPVENFLGEQQLSGACIIDPQVMVPSEDILTDLPEVRVVADSAFPDRGQLALQVAQDVLSAVISVESSCLVSKEEFQQEVVVTFPPYIPEDEIIPDPHLDFWERMPEFPGGEKALYQFLDHHLRYPFACVESGIQGRVVVGFVVGRDGGVTDAVVIRGVHPLLDKEALRVISMMPLWRPAMYRNRPVRVKYIVPVTFCLQ